MLVDDAIRILGWLVDKRDEAVALLSELALLESPSTDPGSQTPVLHLIAQHLERCGFVTTLLPSTGNSGPHLYARPAARERGQPVQLIVGHCDTVWRHGTIATMPVVKTGGKLTGPGVFDMKGGLVQLIMSLNVIDALSKSIELCPIVFINSDEEIGSPASTRHIARLARVADRALVLEPALTPEGKLKTSRRGTGRFNVRVTGVSAHAGIEPGKGASAILELSHVIQALHALNDPERGISVNVGMIDGGIRPNVVAADSSAVVDVRVEREADVDMLERQIQSIAPITPDTRVSITGAIGRPPMEPNGRNQALWQQTYALGKALDLDLEQGLSGGSSDANTTSRYTATIDGLGAVGDGAHAAHEFVFVDKLIERAALLALLLLAPPISTAQVEATR